MDLKEIKKKILGSLTETQKYAILLVGANDFQPIHGKTWFQKELFLISNNIDSLKEDASFESDFMGPYSENVNEALDRLAVYDIIEIKDSSIKLTEFGKSVFKSIYREINKEQKEVISDFKNLLNDMDYLDLLGFIYFSYPEFIDESTVKEKVFPRRKEIAIKLFIKGKISLTKASEMADMPLEEFVQVVKSRGAKVYSE